MRRSPKADADQGMQVKRRRRQASRSRLPVLGGAKARVVAVAATVVVLAGAGVTYASTVAFGNHKVGTHYANGIQVSDNQIIKPLGDRLLTQFGKFMGSTVSPDGRFLAATSADKSVALQIFDLSDYKLIWTVGNAAAVNQTLSDGTVGQEGPTYSPDGKFLWLPQQDGLTRFPVNADGTLGTPTTFPIPAVGGHSALVGQTAYSPDGSALYAAINGQNTVVALDPTTGTVENTWNVGIAPRELTFVRGKLYVSNEGGRQAQPGDTTMDSYGTAVPADGYLGTSTTGTVSVIDPTDPSAAVSSIPVGLHPTAMYRDGNALFVANTNSDTVSVIDTTTDQVVQTIETKPWPSSSVGYEPDGIDVTNDGHLLVSLGRANAVAVYRYDGTPQDPVSYIGLLPTDYYPADVATAGGQIVVTNTRGIDARGPAITTYKGLGTVPVSGHDTHSTTGSLTRFTLPSDLDIARDTATVFAQNGWGPNDVQEASGRSPAPRPVPTRIGDPSTIKHVVLIVKENRTYDQLFGDIGKGNGDRSLAQFGEKVTPNQHALAKQFGLYDNTYDIGTNSAEGHNWLMQGDNPEYTESSAGEYTRSYDTEEDVLGHQRSGFLWTAVQSAGATAKNYGEFEYMEGKPPGTWQQYYCASKSVDHGGDPAAADVSGPEGQLRLGDPVAECDRRPAVPAVRPLDPGHLPLADLEAGLRAERPRQLQHDVALQRSHRRADDPRGRGGRQRPRRWQDRRHDLTQQVLEGHRHLRPRGRQPGRRRPRRRPPCPGPGHQPLGPARQGHRHVLLADLGGPDDRADPRRPTAEREGRGGHADVQRVHLKAGLHAVRCGAEPDPAHRGHHHAAGVWAGHPGHDRRRRGSAEQGSGSEHRGARERNGHRQCLAHLAAPSST